MNLVGNFLFMFVADQFATLYYYDKNYNLKHFSFDPSGLYFGAVSKIVCSYFILREGVKIFKNVKPVL